MIKIGNSYFKKDQIAAIQPRAISGDVYVYLVHGDVVSVQVEEEDLQELLEQSGLLSSGPSVEILEFAPGEHQALWLAYEDGFLFAAKDQSGQVYVYSNRPEKQTQTWIDQDEGKPPMRLHGDFECLSFDDAEPLDLKALFCFSDAGEEDPDA